MLYRGEKTSDKQPLENTGEDTTNSSTLLDEISDEFMENALTFDHKLHVGSNHKNGT